MKTIAILIGIIVGLGVILGAFYYIRREKQKEKQAAINEIRDRLVKAIKKEGYDQSIIQSAYEEFSDSHDLVKAAAEEVYSMACKNAAKDGVIDDDDTKRLVKLQNTLDLDSSRCKEILDSSSAAQYKDKVEEVLAVGTFSEKEVRELRELREKLKVQGATAHNLLKNEVIESYVVLFRKIIEDGRITTGELEELRHFQDAMGLSRKEANKIIRKDAMKLYSQWFYNIVQDGDITVEEEKSLDWLRDTFDIDTPEVRRFENQMRSIKQMAAFRKGNLPVVDTDKLLESGEICHWESRCTFMWSTPTRDKDEQGELLVTSNRVIFTSPTKSFNFSPSAIIDIIVYSDAIKLKTSGSRGTGTYQAKEPKMLEAIITGVARKHKYTTISDYSSEMSRHIPDWVRREVWQRDSGKCIKCTATEYLEFDHIIPHAKGGASTVNNVQLLCRKCNNYKSDRI